MFVPLSTLALTAVLLVAGSDGVPKLDINPSCRDAATLGEDMNTTFDQCMNDEHDALAQLQKEWNKFSVSDRQSCTAEQSDIVGLSSLSSYVELLECLILAREAQSDIVGLSSLSSYVELLECLILARDAAANSGTTTGSGDH